jgi:hypothetical protein
MFTIVECLEHGIPIAGAHRCHVEHLANMRTTAPDARGKSKGQLEDGLPTALTVKCSGGPARDRRVGPTLRYRHLRGPLRHSRGLAFATLARIRNELKRRPNVVRRHVRHDSTTWSWLGDGPVGSMSPRANLAFMSVGAGDHKGGLQDVRLQLAQRKITSCQGWR